MTVKLLEMTGGRAIIRDVTGEIKFDSNERMFSNTQVSPTIVSGSVSRPARTASYSRNVNGQTSIVAPNINETINLNAVNANANLLLGSFRVTGVAATPGSATIAKASNGVRNYGWFCAGASYVHSFMPSYSFYGGNWITLPGGLCSTYTFTVANGYLQLQEVTRGEAGIISDQYYGSISLSQEAITIDYKFFVGMFV